ncbi:50S ribosomal protein L18 [bacterium]|nr:50S ribosomal protein L18 [bacterium]
MSKIKAKKERKDRKRGRIRKKVMGSSEAPRVFVFKSNRYIYTQAIDDEQGVVLTSASTLEKEFREKNQNTKNTEASKILGQLLAQRLKQKKIQNVVFDRGYYSYHGRVKALAESMRKEGLSF